MKKLGQLLSILISLGMGLSMGMVIGEAAGLTLSETSPLAAVGWVLLLAAFVAFAVLFQIAAHEGGHWLFGRLTGYQFVSYRLLGMMWQMEDGRVRFCRYSVAGTAGQCLMDPPDLVDGRIPGMLYNFGGAIVNLATAAIAGALLLLCGDALALRTLLRLVAIVGVSMAALNGIPMCLKAVDNDGMNALEFRRSPEAVRAFWIQLKISAELARGRRLSDMPEEWFVLPNAEGMKNSLVASLPVFTENRLMERHDFAAVEALNARILAAPGALPGLYRWLLVSDSVYCELVGPNRPERVNALATKAFRKVLASMSGQLPMARTQYALALLHDKDIKQAHRLEERFIHMLKAHPYAAEADTERGLFELAKGRGE